MSCGSNDLCKMGRLEKGSSPDHYWHRAIRVMFCPDSGKTGEDIEIISGNLDIF